MIHMAHTPVVRGGTMVAADSSISGHRARWKSTNGQGHPTHVVGELPSVPVALVRRVVVLANSWRPRCLGRLGKGHTETVLENHGLVLIWDALVHDRAVAVSLYMGLQPLMRSAPADATDLLTGKNPLGVSTELLPKVRNVGWVHQVNKRIAQAGAGLEVNGQVQEVVLSLKAFIVQHGHQHLSCVVIGKVPQHHGGALLQGQVAFRRSHGHVGCPQLAGSPSLLSLDILSSHGTAQGIAAGALIAQLLSHLLAVRNRHRGNPGLRGLLVHSLSVHKIHWHENGPSHAVLRRSGGPGGRRNGCGHGRRPRRRVNGILCAILLKHALTKKFILLRQACHLRRQALQVLFGGRGLVVRTR
mmetsp:Transcript_13487/g.22219  ORF Transcript_13487/g.22219 Transcript_13487/m.22219 type:complete len:358 (-) Transcript_13487:631-1704(-)